MSLFEVILIGVVLSIDACAITIANCTTYKCSLTKAREWSMPISFALFQGIMPLIGFFLGSLVANYIRPITKFITAGIFLFLSVKIIIDVLKERNEVCEVDKKSNRSFTLGIVTLQAVATSIDALAVGVTLIDLTFSIFLAVGIIAIATFILVSIALVFGKSLGNLFGCYAEWVGAVILLALAVKSIIEALI